jgi:trk system potassium uptake protein TrkH
MKNLIHPRGFFSLRANKQPVKKDILNSVAGFFFLYIMLLLITAFVVATAGNDILTSISTALVTLGNIGPGFGKVGPVENYAHFPVYVKWFLSFIMMAGRLEIYTVIVIFIPAFWKK